MLYVDPPMPKPASKGPRNSSEILRKTPKIHVRELRESQDARKRRPRPAKRQPRGHQRRRRNLQERPMCGQEEPKSAPEVTQKCPGGSQNPQKCRQGKICTGSCMPKGQGKFFSRFFSVSAFPAKYIKHCKNCGFVARRAFRQRTHDDWQKQRKM